MRIGFGIFLTLALLAAGGCSRQDANATARQTGQKAHQAVREIQKETKNAAHQLKDLGHSARQGWNDADQQKRK